MNPRRILYPAGAALALYLAFIAGLRHRTRV